MKVDYSHALIERGKASNNKTARSLAELAASIMCQLDQLGGHKGFKERKGKAKL